MIYFHLSHFFFAICLGCSDFTGGFEYNSCIKRGVFTGISGAPALSGANDGIVLESSTVAKQKDLTTHICGSKIEMIS